MRDPNIVIFTDGQPRPFMATVHLAGAITIQRLEMP
jgi:hypothetical protein